MLVKEQHATGDDALQSPLPLFIIKLTGRGRYRVGVLHPEHLLIAFSSQLKLAGSDKPDQLLMITHSQLIDCSVPT